MNLKMTQLVDQQYLLKGAVYALEQCGFLLHDANVLYKAGSYASAVVLAAFAREELGRWKLLLKLREEVVGGKQLTIDDVKQSCGDHEAKQKAAMLSTTMRTDRDSTLGRLLNTRLTAKPGSSEWNAADKQIKAIDDKLKKRTPGDRHEQRMSALYVDPISSTDWNRPCMNETKETAYAFIVDVVNDYGVQASQRYAQLDLIKVVNPELYEALTSWTDRPAMPAPEAPHPSEHHAAVR
jgi:AbiV family abortive infection protein